MKDAQLKYTINSDHNLQLIIREKYGIVTSNCFLLLNELSEVYLIETESVNYIFKIYWAMHTHLEMVKGEVELLNSLHDKGARISYPIKSQSDSYIIQFQSVNGDAYGVLYFCAEGRVVFYMDEEQVAAVAREIATMHNITSGLHLAHERNHLNIDDLLFQPLIEIKAAFIERPEDYAFLVDISNKVKVKLKDIDFKQCSYGYCHYDLLPNNFHFNDSNQVTFFDFELSGEGLLINDLVSFNAHYFLQLMHGRITFEEANRAFFLLIKNYTKVRPINSVEIEVFPYFGFAFWVFHIAFDIRHFSERKYTGYLDDNMSYIRKWVEWYLKDKL